MLKSKQIMNPAGTHTTYYGYRRNSKRLWRSGRLANAFKNSIDYHARIPALRTFYDYIEDSIKVIYAMMSETYEVDSPKKVKAQLSICYTDYPAGILAAIGHTDWLQYKSLLKDSDISIYNFNKAIERIKLPEGVHPECFEKMVNIIQQAVSERLAYEELMQSDLGQVIEAYRFFLAANDKLEFHYFPEMVRAAIILGDLLPDFQEMDLHDLTKEILTVIRINSMPFFDELSKAVPGEYYEIGSRWIRRLARRISSYLPPMEGSVDPSAPGQRQSRSIPRTNLGMPRSANEEFPGFDQKSPPLLEAPTKLEDLFTADMKKNPVPMDVKKQISSENLPDHIKEMMSLLTSIAQTISTASGQRPIEDTRSDILLNELLANPFAAASIQGTSMEGNEIDVDLGEKGTMKGQIFDKTLELSYDLPEIEKLRTKAKPITDKIKSALYPNAEEILITERLRSSGCIDRGRLPYYQFKDSIFKRFVLEHKFQKDGRSLMLLVCDGSSSMHEKKFKMLRILTVAWLESTMKSKIQVMAGIYDDGLVSAGRYGAKMEWIYHPRKTISMSQKEAVRAVASVPHRGYGGQKDALSISYCLQEAEIVARGNNIYMIHITDTGWCGSFNTGLRADEEIVNVVSQFKDKRKGQLHYTLVGLDTDTPGGLEQVIDEFISLSEYELENPFNAASKIAKYGSSILKKHKNKYQLI
jgi:hypothetical protein